MAKQYELPLTDPGTDTDNAVRDAEIISQAVAILTVRHRRGEALTSPDLTKHFLQLRLADKHNEVFGCIFLDNRHRIIAVEDIFFGTIDGATVHPRVVVEKSLGHHAAALVIYHNHPSGVPEPSQADIRITARIKDALALVDVRLLDHLVVTVEGCVSFAERSLL